MSHLDRLTPLLGIIAAERTKDRPDLFDEVRQEALIAAWRVETERPDASREYVLASARRAANDVLRGRPGFGVTGRRGWQDAHDAAGPLVADEETDVDTVAPLADRAAVAAFEAAELADAREAVRRALSGLSTADATLVLLRFWEGLTWPEIGSRVGLSANAVRVRFEKHLAPALRERLAPYREIAA